MLKALSKAINDVTSPALRGVLWKSIGLSIALFAALWVGIEFLVAFLVQFQWHWLTTMAQITTGLGLFAAFFFLMGPVTTLFAGLFQDAISVKVEARHYPLDPQGRPLSFMVGLAAAVKFTALALALNMVVLPLVLFAGFGAVLFLLANAYLISREYFEMAAGRYMPMQAAADLRRQNFFKIYMAGLVPAALALIPFINFITPVFATSYFLHLFKAMRSSD